MCICCVRNRKLRAGIGIMREVVRIAATRGRKKLKQLLKMRGNASVIVLDSYYFLSTIASLS